VYELGDGEVSKVEATGVEFLSREETLAQYTLWRNSPGRSRLATPLNIQKG
jgi:hypothetical protein